jgi:hypothetical protein
LSPALQGQQAPARDTAAPRTDTRTFRLRGRVLASDTGAPIRRAIVRISSQQLPNGRSALTDMDGRYEFRDVPAGTCYASASKTGFLAAQPGSEFLGGGGGKSVKVGDVLDADGRGTTAADIVLARACAIGGRVVDELGDPIGGSYVQLLRSQSNGGVRQMMMTGGSSTNDLGQYRAYGLQPGTYFVFVGRVQGPEGEIGEDAWYAPSYYPGTPNFSQASPIRVSAGQDMTGADIIVSPVRTARVSGVALDASGRAAAGAAVTVRLTQPGLVETLVGSYARVLPDGTFSVDGVPPGDYILTLGRWSASLPGAPPRREFGRTNISLNGGDITGITIQASAGSTVSGQVIFEGASPLPKAKLEVTADPIPNEPFSPPITRATPAADGSFVLTGVFGDRLFRIDGLPTGLALKAVFVDGRDVTDTPVPFDGREQVTGVQIVVTDRITHLTATVTDDAGQPADGASVFVVPDDPARSASFFGSRYRRMVDVARTGKAKLDGLPPGDYVAVVFGQKPKYIDIYDPDYVEQVRKTGMKFSLREAESREIALKPGPPSPK